MAHALRRARGTVSSTKSRLSLGPGHDEQIYVADQQRQRHGLRFGAGRENRNDAAIQKAEGRPPRQTEFQALVQTLQQTRSIPGRFALDRERRRGCPIADHGHACDRRAKAHNPSGDAEPVPGCAARHTADCMMPTSEQLEEIGALATMVDENRYQYSLDALCTWRGLPGKDESALLEGCRALGLISNRRKKFRPQEYLWRLPAHYVGP